MSSYLEFFGFPLGPFDKIGMMLTILQSSDTEAVLKDS